jgi:hypothetical protein
MDSSGIGLDQFPRFYAEHRIRCDTIIKPIMPETVRANPIGIGIPQMSRTWSTWGTESGVCEVWGPRDEDIAAVPA